ncbi:MAG: hypothetical protein HYV28_04485 [Ignavibacteriales bacterium]|nr:hypothetical protein [Ignavibacteriales bacterium]
MAVTEKRINKSFPKLSGSRIFSHSELLTYTIAQAIPSMLKRVLDMTSPDFEPDIDEKVNAITNDIQKSI